MPFTDLYETIPKATSALENFILSAHVSPQFNSKEIPELGSGNYLPGDKSICA
jgi:hypothetical protein